MMMMNAQILRILHGPVPCTCQTAQSAYITMQVAQITMQIAYTSHSLILSELWSFTCSIPRKRSEERKQLCKSCSVICKKSCCGAAVKQRSQSAFAWLQSNSEADLLLQGCSRRAKQICVCCTSKAARQAADRAGKRPQQCWAVQPTVALGLVHCTGRISLLQAVLCTASG